MDVFFSSKLFSGSDFVISEKSETVRNRRPGDVGLYFFTAIALYPEDVDLVAIRQRHQRTLTI